MSTTESASNYNSLEQMSVRELLQNINREDQTVPQAVAKAIPQLEALVQANKQFDWAIYPDKNHGIYGGATRLQLYTKMTNFIKEKL